MKLFDTLDGKIDVLARSLTARSREGARARRRALAGGAMAVAWLAFCAAAGLWTVVAVVGVLIVAAAAVVAGIEARRRWSPAVAAVLGRTFVEARRARAHVRRREARLEPVRRSASWGRARTRAFIKAVEEARASLAAGTAIQARLPRVDLAALVERRRSRALEPSVRPIDRQRTALALNARGVQLRRESEPEEAAALHRQALAIFRELGDRRSEALTLNNLALALDRGGDDGAVALFEQAASILGELGDEQHEGQVIANMAVAFRRRGRDERSAEVAELALAKLDPQSHAYRAVESFRRAS
jgi:tetratricopeptide (TPR) repeat protein